ncbi:hypothetical protein ElyMa_000517000 [Elysia marginata]|uniref:Uncharacterized protein n=1 Tax=Elysia marginata TaxID=1093978 RepID=A0AAV4FZG4_9GAST|nr:hypothetical protein ElyMa_000517000 [Elysia marginata]
MRLSALLSPPHVTEPNFDVRGVLSPSRSNATASRYGPASREASPVSTRSSRYDNSSSASGPYSTYSSYKSGGSEPTHSPAPGVRATGRAYERQSSRGYEVPGNEFGSSSRRSSHGGAGGAGAGGGGASAGMSLPGARAPHTPHDSSRRGRLAVSAVSSGSDDSAPEAEKRDTATFRYLICRGTSPIPEGEQREPRVKDKSSVSRTRRLKVPDKSPPVRSERSSRKAISDKGPVDCSIQTNLDQPQGRRQRTSSNTNFPPDKGATKPGETYYKYRDKVLGPNPDSPRSYYKHSGQDQQPAPSRAGGRSREDSWRGHRGEDSVNTPPNERSWRQSVYGEPEPASPRRREQPVYGEPEPASPRRREQPVEGDPDSDTDDRSSRYGRRRRGGGDGPRTSTPSTLRDRDASDLADERKSRRSKASRSSSREDMLDGDRPRRKRHSSKEFLDEREADVDMKPPLTPESLNVRDSIEKVQHWKQNLPPPEPMSPRGAYEEQPRGRTSRQYSSHREETPPGHVRPSRHASRHGSRDSMLEDEDERDPSLPNKDFRKSQLNRADHYYDDPEVFEREGSPGDSRRRQRKGEGGYDRVPRSASDDHKRLNRDNSRESILSENRRSRPGEEISDSNGSQFGFNREDSPNTRRGGKHSGRHSRQGSREDGLEERGGNPNRHSTTPQNSVHEQIDAPPTHFQLQQPPPPKHNRHQQQQQQHPPQLQHYKGQRSGMIGDVDDIDNVLSLRHPPRSNSNIMDEPVPPNYHYPLHPAPAGHAGPASPAASPSYDKGGNQDRARPNSYAFEQQGPNGNNMRPSKSHGDRLLDIEGGSTPGQHHPSRGRRQPSATAQQMWSILQSKKGLVTITDFVSLCEKSGPQRKLITVPGAGESGEQYFKGYSSADEMLESMGVDVRKQNQYRYFQNQIVATPLKPTSSTDCCF